MHPIAADINLAHLDRLSKRVPTPSGEPALLTHIYADPPNYDPVVAPGEGIACVDDVARAAIVYLEQHARTGDAHALGQARAALEFTMRMQLPDGSFHNFVIDDSLTINRSGATSQAGLGWWAMRGMWALARGYRTFAQVDPVYAGRLLAAYDRTEGAVGRTIAGTNGPAAVVPHGHATPADPGAWLARLPADQSALGVLAMSEMQEARPNARTAGLLGTLAEGIGSLATPGQPAGATARIAHTNSMPQLWHAWGADEPRALARAGRVLGRSDLIEAARGAVEGIFAWQLAAGRVHELTPLPVREGQQAYGVNSAVQGALELHRATGDVRYARMAGLHASWFYGNNMAGEAMYDPASGRAYDGIDGAARGVNRSSGAESTIEALMALQAVAGVPEADRFARMRPVESASWATAVVKAPQPGGSDQPDSAPQPGSAPATGGGRGPGDTTGGTGVMVRITAAATPDAPVIDAMELGKGTELSLRVDAPRAGDYQLFVAGMRREGGAAAASPHGLEIELNGRAVGALGARALPLDAPALAAVPGPALHLREGANDIVLRAIGGAGGAPAVVQGVLVHPVVTHTTLRAPNGDAARLSFDLRSRNLRIEAPPSAARITPR